MAYGNVGYYPPQQQPTLYGAAANAAGSLGAADAAAAGNQNAIGTQTGTMGNVNTLFGAQTGLGNGAFGALGSTLGVNGQPADYSNFYSMPGYNFAVGAGTQAIDRQASAAGNLYTPNTLTNVGQYVTGTAMGDYNTYVQQLLSAGGLGAQANNTRAGAYLGTGANISQLQSNIGQNRAGGIAGSAGAVGNFLNSPNGSGMVNAAGNYVSNYLNGGGGGGGGGGYGGVNTGTDAAGGYYDAGGNYIPANSYGNSGNTPGDMNTGYDNSTTDPTQSQGAYGGPG